MTLEMREPEPDFSLLSSSDLLPLLLHCLLMTSMDQLVSTDSRMEFGGTNGNYLAETSTNVFAVSSIHKKIILDFIKDEELVLPTTST